MKNLLVLLSCLSLSTITLCPPKTWAAVSGAASTKDATALVQSDNSGKQSSLVQHLNERQVKNDTWNKKDIISRWSTFAGSERLKKKQEQEKNKN